MTLCVNALSGLYLISTRRSVQLNCNRYLGCVNALSGLYLISTLKDLQRRFGIEYCVNALSGLYLISTVRRLQDKGIKCVAVSMPSRAYTSFLL